MPVLLPPPVIEGFDPPMAPVPDLDQHTDAILSELGFAAEQIARYVARLVSFKGLQA